VSLVAALHCCASPCSINETKFFRSFILNLPRCTIRIEHIQPHDILSMCQCNMSAHPHCMPRHAMPHHLVHHLLHPLVSTPHPLTSKFHSHCTSNPAPDDTHIAYPLPTDATRARHLNNLHSNVTQCAPHHTFALYVAMLDCCQQTSLFFFSLPSLALFLHASDSQPTTDRW